MNEQIAEVDVSSAIYVSDLRRIYRAQTGVFRKQTKQIIALDGISFDIKRGELFGLIGPNGAGKTTTIKILTTLLLPTTGIAKVLGYDVRYQEKAIRSRISFMLGGERGLYWRLSGRDNLRYFADLYNVPPGVSAQRIPKLFELVGLKGREDEKVQGYSRGMKQRLHIARMLLPNPDVLFLDEPTIGMDPIGAQHMWETIQALKQLGKTILLTTHDMFEANVLCDRIAVINKGLIIALDTPAGLKSRVSDLNVFEVEIFGSPAAVDGKLTDIAKSQTLQLQQLAEDHFRLTLQAEGGVGELPGLVAALDGFHIGRIIFREPTLSDVYHRLIKADK